MRRRDMLLSGLFGAAAGVPSLQPAHAQTSPGATVSDHIRDQFSELGRQTYLNAAGMMPLSQAAQQGIGTYLRFQQAHRPSADVEYVNRMWREIRGLFAVLIGADEREVGLVHCTKAGEQIALDAVDSIKRGGNIVTNDLHFSRSLHNLIGLRRAGRDVRIVRASDWTVNADAMEAVIDRNTALVAVSMVSNVNGHIEDMAAITEIAHRHGALVYADIIQAAGIVPIKVHKLGIDVAACSSYKWLYGTYGSGFLFVNEKLQGNIIPDRMFPGQTAPNYAPWTDRPDTESPDLPFRAPDDARRYQPGHPSYMGYCAAYEGLKLLGRMGTEAALKHNVQLNKRAIAGLDPEQYRRITPDPDSSPMVTFIAREPEIARQRMIKSQIKASQSGNRIRISPALFNREADINHLIETLNG